MIKVTECIQNTERAGHKLILNILGGLAVLDPLFNLSSEQDQEEFSGSWPENDDNSHNSFKWM